MGKEKLRQSLQRCAFWLLCLLAFFPPLALAEEQFSEFEIRVIRPRYFIKRNKFELGLSGSVITSQTFIYTFLGAATLGYHINDAFGIELLGMVGASIDKEDTTDLDQTFNIKTQILRTSMVYTGSLMWTPIYGKYQLASGRLIYFDMYLLGGMGLTEAEHRFIQCSRDASQAPPPPKTVGYTTYAFGLGQRFFLSKEDSIKWDVKDHLFFVSNQDSKCPDTEVAEVESTTNNITISIGYSRFF